jgi:DNA-binding response OmpR family regulator
MSRGRASVNRTKQASANTLRRPRPAARHSERVIDARLETSPATSDRLLDALSSGTRDFVLTSTDGRLSARVRLTIANVSMSEHELAGAKVVIDWSQSTAAHGPRRVAFSRTELRLFAALLDANGRPLPRRGLIERIWPDDAHRMMERENALAVYVCSLRKHLTMIGVGGALRTIRGVGYQLVTQAALPPDSGRR